MKNDRWIAGLEDSLGRRSFLRGLAGLAAAAALPWPVHAARAGVFSAGERRVLLAAIEALVPMDGPLGLRELGVDVVANVENLIGRLSPMAATGLKGLLVVLDRGSFLLTRKLVVFTGLPVGDRAQMLEELDRHGDIVHQGIFRAVKSLAMAGVYTDPKVQARLGYEGPWTMAGTPPGGVR